MSVGAAGLFFLVFFGLLIPLLAYRARNRLLEIQPPPTRARLYVSTIVQLGLFLFLAVLTARTESVPLWREPRHWAIPALVTLALLAVMLVATRPIKRAAVERRDPRVYFTMPANRREMALWIGLSLMAGLAEETAYRGVFSDLALRLTGSVWLAWSGAVLAFTIAHANQGMRSMAVIATFAIVAHVLVYFSGTLLFAIVLHAVYDVLAGFEYVRLGRQLGYPQRLPDAAAAPDVTVPPAASSP
ncbi:MAG TPA: CPBP family intramembrane glutamic endopeptidase [Gemmatimonadaceae bacterium]|nr:CPBP family intramembrane glutamic endopeptidase [Gemmatimonadaceae bacterium]